MCPLLLAILVFASAGPQAAAEDMVWRVSKSSGDVSVTTSAGEQAALIAGATLKPGDNIRTGQNGRALLVRGEETILISPNSAIGIPKARKEDCRPASSSNRARSCSRSRNETSSTSRSNAVSRRRG